VGARSRIRCAGSTEYLIDADRKWLRRLRLGSRFVVISSVVWAIAIVFAGSVEPRGWGHLILAGIASQPAAWNLWLVHPLASWCFDKIAALLAMGLRAWGTWQLASPPSGVYERRKVLRRCVRGMAAANIVLLGVFLVLKAFWPVLGERERLVALVLMLVEPPANWLFWTYFRHLALRGPGRHLAWAAGAVRWAALLSFAIIVPAGLGAFAVVAAGGSRVVGMILFIALFVGAALLAASGLAGVLVLWTFARWLGASPASEPPLPGRGGLTGVIEAATPA
jgi:hypothetical protein